MLPFGITLGPITPRGCLVVKQTVYATQEV